MPDALSRISQERRDGGKMTCWRLVDSVRPCAGAGRCNVCPTLAQRAQNSRFHAWTDVPYLLASSHTAILDRAAILIPEARNCMLCCDVVDQAYYAVSEKRSSKSAGIKSHSMGAGQKVGDKRCTLAGVVVHENAFCSGLELVLPCGRANLPPIYAQGRKL